MRITPAARTLHGWDDAEGMWAQVGETIALLLKTLDEQIYKALGEIYADGHENVQDLMGELGTLMCRLGEAEAAVLRHDAQTVQ